MVSMTEEHSYIRSLIRQQASDLDEGQAGGLAGIWGEVVAAVVDAMLGLSAEREIELHIDLKAEMCFELAKLLLHLSEIVVATRTAGRALAEIELDAERESCLGPAGARKIENTARNIFDSFWSKRMQERWLP